MAGALSGTAGIGPVGLLGGTFDPVHAGHLQLARSAQSALGLAELRFLPAGAPWQKQAPSPAELRLGMLERAVAGVPGWHIDARELRRPGPTFTVETLLELRAELGPARPLVWVLGWDQLRRLDSWHRWRELPGLAHLAVAQRAGHPGPGADAPRGLAADEGAGGPDLPPAVAALVAERAGAAADLRAPAGRVVEFAMPAVDCSATRLRALLAADGPQAQEEVGRYVPAAVLDYIRDHRLYR